MNDSIDKTEAEMYLKQLHGKIITVEDVLYKLSYMQLLALSSKWGEKIRKENGLTKAEIFIGLRNASEENDFIKELAQKRTLDNEMYIME